MFCGFIFSLMLLSLIYQTKIGKEFLKYQRINYFCLNITFNSSIRIIIYKCSFTLIASDRILYKIIFSFIFNETDVYDSESHLKRSLFTIVLHAPWLWSWWPSFDHDTITLHSIISCIRYIYIFRNWKKKGRNYISEKIYF